VQATELLHRRTKDAGFGITHDGAIHDELEAKHFVPASWGNDQPELAIVC
jgi:hypothetical protein